MRVPRSEVQRHLAEEAASFEYGGQKYRFQHLASFVGGTPASMPEHDAAVPVILVRAGEHSTAIVTDELIGSREIVVKTVGPADFRHPRHLRRDHPGRRPHLRHPRLGALVRSEWRQRPAAGLRAAAPCRRSTGASSRSWSTTRSPCGA